VEALVCPVFDIRKNITQFEGSTLRQLAFLIRIVLAWRINGMMPIG
jgi:hypothetical protein